MPLPCYASGVRARIEGLGSCHVIVGADNKGYVFLPCGTNAHLYALADAKKIAELLNKDYEHEHGNPV